MAEVDGIETPAEKSNFHSAQRGCARPDGQGSIPETHRAVFGLSGSGSPVTCCNCRFQAESAGTTAFGRESVRPCGLAGVPSTSRLCWQRRLPGWWNGRHKGLKIPWPQGRAGSSPAPGTNNLQKYRQNARKCLAVYLTESEESPPTPVHVEFACPILHFLAGEAGIPKVRGAETDFMVMHSYP